MQCPVSAYDADVPTVRKTKQRTVVVDDELWADCHAIARARRTRVSDVIRAKLLEFRDENADLLAEIKAEDAHRPTAEQQERAQ
jgi:hypothetical protein